MERTYEVDCYFPMQRNCHVTLYQDAHCPKKMRHFEALEKPSGKKYKPESCWKDVHKALVRAERIICITGWSVWTKLKLLRGEDAAKDDRTLGEILLEKAEQGVQVQAV